MLDTKRNPEATGVWVAVGLLFAGIILLTGPSLAGMDGMNGGFALGAFGLLLVITALITLALALPRAARMKEMLAGQNLLAHWVYEPAAMDTEAERIRRQWSDRNRALFAIVLIWTLVITAAFVVYMLASDQSDALPLFLAIMLGVTVIVAAFAFGMPEVMARRARHGRSEALIGSRGLYFGGALYTWGSSLETLDSVDIVHDAQGARLAFHLRSRSAPYLQFLPYLVEVPIPPGQDAAAAALIARLQGN